MVYIQLGSYPEDGIPNSDGYCFGKLTDRHDSNDPIYRFRDHPASNYNNGGWNISLCNKTTFRLQLIF